MSITEIIQNLGNFYTFGDAITHENFTVYPIVKSDSNLSILGLVEGEAKDLAWIQESEGAESVAHLEAINKSPYPVLIPYLHQVVGGKQDRTIFEPIIVPTGHDERNPLIIPARCIEQSRWTYRSSRGVATSKRFSSGVTRMAPQMANISSEDGDQSVLWNSVGYYASSLGYGAAESPSSSYREFQEAAYEKDHHFQDLFQHFSTSLNLSDQTGIICFYGDKILGLEFYGTNSLWTQFSESVLKGFLSDHVFLKDVKISSHPESKIGEILTNEFSKIELEEKPTTGSGKLYQLSHDKWQGITIQYNQQPVHFYATKRQIDLFKGKKTRLRSQRAIRFDEQIQEVRNQAAPDQIIIEQRQQ
ncbi:MAG: ARPP-1 family domain-containing protein [Candidatus Hodarchaeales archaeon]